MASLTHVEKVNVQQSLHITSIVIKSCLSHIYASSCGVSKRHSSYVSLISCGNLMLIEDWNLESFK